MNKTMVISCLGILLLAGATGFATQRTTNFTTTHAPQAKSFETIFSESLSAMGDKNELSKIQSITALANCSGPRGKIATEIYSQRGNRLKFKQVWPDGGTFVNGEHAWMEDPNSGHVSPLDRASAAGIRAHEFQMIALVLPERYNNPVVEGEEDFAGERCIKIRMTDELGQPCAVFFKTRPSLLAGFINADTRRDKGEPVRVVFNEWKKVGNVMLPSKVTATDKSGDWVLDFHDLKLNEVNEKVFVVPPSIAAVQELTQLQQQGRAAHFGKDAMLLVSVFADDFINIGAGKITRPTREESRHRLQAYFDRSEFLEWDDISPPIIRVSQDASMAYVIVHKRVRLKAKNEKGDLEEETTIFAWKVEDYAKLHLCDLRRAVCRNREAARPLFDL